MTPAQLSVNINKYALVRNSRGRNAPDLLDVVGWCLEAGAHGITVHPRLDQRHVRLDDVPALAEHLRRHHPGVELNVECEPAPALLELVEAVRPDQCTLVPVRPGELTSDHGWDLPAETSILGPAIRRVREAGVRVSLFVDCAPGPMAPARDLGADRVELYTGPYAWAWGGPEADRERARVFAAAEAAVAAGLDLNAGHDLDRHNLVGLRGLPALLEVSIGHALVCRALEVGTARSIHELLAALGW